MAGIGRADAEAVRVAGPHTVGAGHLTGMSMAGVMQPLPMVYLLLQAFPPGTDIREIAAAGSTPPDDLDRFTFALAADQARAMGQELIDAAGRADATG